MKNKGEIEEEIKKCNGESKDLSTLGRALNIFKNYKEKDLVQIKLAIDWILETMEY